MLLIKAGERVALMGTMAAQPRGGRAQLNRMALELGGEPREGRPDYGAPPPDHFARGGRAVFFSDFLGEPDALMPALAEAADQGVRGCFVQVLDESEEVFPFDGRVIFESMGGATEFETQRARALREAYAARLADAAGAAGRARPQPRLAGASSTIRTRARARRCSGSTWRWAIGGGEADDRDPRLRRALALARPSHACRSSGGSCAPSRRRRRGGRSRACGCCSG